MATGVGPKAKSCEECTDEAVATHTCVQCDMLLCEVLLLIPGICKGLQGTDATPTLCLVLCFARDQCSPPNLVSRSVCGNTGRASARLLMKYGKILNDCTVNALSCPSSNPLYQGP
jgi:hypothetical protein